MPGTWDMLLARRDQEITILRALVAELEEGKFERDQEWHAQVTALEARAEQAERERDELAMRLGRREVSELDCPWCLGSGHKDDEGVFKSQVLAILQTTKQETEAETNPEVGPVALEMIREARRAAVQAHTQHDTVSEGESTDD